MWRRISFFICLAGSLARAQSITIEQAVREALEKNLGLLAEKYNVSIAEARTITARLRPNPVFSFDADYQDWFGSGFTSKGAIPPLSNGGPPEVGFRVDFPLEGGGKRQRRIELAEETRSVTQLQFLNSARQVILDAQSAVVDLLAARDNLELARENLKAFRGITEANVARVRAGDLAKVELLRTQVAELQFQNAVRQAELRLQAARSRLQLTLGRTTLSPDFDVVGSLRRDDRIPSLDELRGMALKARPDLQAVIRDQARSLADERLQIAQGKVDYSVGAQWHHQYGNARGESFGLFFSVPIPAFNRNQGEIERARREHQQLDARVKALEALIANEVENAWRQGMTARATLEAVEKDMLQQAREVRGIMEYSYRRGEASLLEFLDAQRAFNDTMQTSNDARAEYARSLYLLDSITGKAVTP